MTPQNEQVRARTVLRMRKLERVLAWTMSALAVILTSCFFVLVGLQLPMLDQPVWGTPLSLGAALGMACLVAFAAMIVIFTLVSDKIDRTDRNGPAGS